MHGHADLRLAPEKARHERDGEHRHHNNVAPPDGLRRVVAFDRVDRNENLAQLLHGKRAQPNEVRHAEKRARAQRRANGEADGHRHFRSLHKAIAREAVDNPRANARVPHERRRGILERHGRFREGVEHRFDRLPETGVHRAIRAIRNAQQKADDGAAPHKFA